MIRILTVAAAAALIAAPAAAQSVRVATAGKSTEQLNADIAKAAKKVCNRAIVGSSFPQQMYASCYKHAVIEASAKVAGGQFAAATTTTGSAN
jgi:gas vesicle protein